MLPGERLCGDGRDGPWWLVQFYSIHRLLVMLRLSFNGWAQAAVMALAALLSGPVFAVDHLVYPRSESASDSQYDYDYGLLRLALEVTRRSHGSFELRASDVPMNQARAASELVAGGGVTVMARSTSTEHENRMLPVRFPLDKGLVGYRIFLIHRAMQARLAGVGTVADLRRFSIGALETWADAAILRQAGFEVVGGDSYEGLFHMLVGGRFDMFSRSVDEAFREWDERNASLPDLAVEEGLLLHFPTTRYFFFQRSPAGHALAERVEAGLEALLRSGAFDAHFQKYKGPLIARAQLERRRIIHIKNPLLPTATPLNRKQLWIDLDSMAAEKRSLCGRAAKPPADPVKCGR